MPPTRISAQQAADRLGVKPATVYAYVSRGILERHPAIDARRSLFDVDEVDRIARRGRPRRSSRRFVFELEIETGLTEITDHTLRYRGHDAAELATTATFEQVAELMWFGTLPSSDEALRTAWEPLNFAEPERRPGRTSATTQTATPPVAQGVVDRIRAAVATAAGYDETRGLLDREAVASCARSIVATSVEVLRPWSSAIDSMLGLGQTRVPRLVLDGVAPIRGSIAGRVWSGLASARARPESVRLINATLVLLVDHELAASTLSARVAASTRADPYAVVSAGLGPLSGPLHGGASRFVRSMFDSSRRGGGAAAAVADAIRVHGRIPGLGHPLYPGGDPRAVVLLDLLRAAEGGSRALGEVEAVLAAVRRRIPVPPNVDAALAAIGHVYSMPVDSGEALFAVARSVGWIAHALEEYDAAPLRFRPRARYVPDMHHRPTDSA